MTHLPVGAHLKHLQQNLKQNTKFKLNEKILDIKNINPFLYFQF